MAFLTKAANRGSIATGYDIDNSLKFESNNSEHLHRTPSSAGNTKTWTYSVWFKRTELGLSAQLISALDTYMYFETNDQAWLNFRSGGENFFLATNRVFRDTSAWYHAVIVCDVTDSTAADRAKLYINGVRETSYANSTYQNLDSNDTTGINAATVHRVGAYSNYGAYFNGYMAEAHLIDGQALDPTDFGEFDDNNIWIPKEYTGTYGTNGFYLDFSDGANLGDDASGNGNNFTEAAITSADQATDTPTNNFCTWSPLFAFYRNSTITEGGTEVAGAAGGWSHAGASMGVMNGRWYWEWKITSSEIGFISFSTLEGNLNLNQLGHDNSVVMGYAAGNLYTWLNGVFGSNESTGWGTWAVNDIIGIYLDLENSDRRFTLYKNGSAISGSTSFPVSFPNAMQAVNGAGNIFPYNVQYENDGGEWNFGGYTTMSNSKSNSDANGYGSFVYSPVLGGVNYYAICTKNLAEYGG
jgi:hypothetical protein